MKRFSLFFLISLFAFGMWSCGESHDHTDEKEKSHKVANIAWKDLAHNDTVSVGDTMTYGYVYFNTGWKPVHLEKCTPRTGELTFSLPKEETLVGEQDTLWVTAVFTEAGASTQFFDVTHNTPQKPFLLALTAWVEEK